MADKLILGVPSKGRLAEKTAEIFAKADMALTRYSSRGYQGALKNTSGVDVIYLSASEIAERLAEGKIHFGVTGIDLLHEMSGLAELPYADPDNLPDYIPHVVSGLGFGRADIVIAVPDGWIDVTHIDDLDEVATDFNRRKKRYMRVATKYPYLTRNFFAERRMVNYEVVFSAGATEGAPAAGAAEFIVDITSSGATLDANQLRVLEDGVILPSQACLAASRKAEWPKTMRESARQILMRLSSYVNAQNTMRVAFVIDRARAQWAMDYTPFLQKYEARLVNESDRAMAFLIPDSKYMGFIEDMMAQGGFADAIVTRPDFIFSGKNEFFERLMAELPPLKA